MVVAVVHPSQVAAQQAGVVAGVPAPQARAADWPALRGAAERRTKRRAAEAVRAMRAAARGQQRKPAQEEAARHGFVPRSRR
ncbi:hypothetical protein MNVI_37850 [Mycobacterium noviomagense]|uniref:Uncharacterized protein n=1 Tax=Mycobacterium noviomagense TaxID=459858 RepID=A0A7I7PIK3_9MYCO|nr:hypothetical protein MNVI_37850 [Mycobacterium noviomagense]